MCGIQLWADSIGKGIVFDEARKRYVITPDRCAVTLEKALGIPLENHSRMGAVVTEGYRDVLETPGKQGQIAVIAYGGNDCDMPWQAVSEDPDAPRDGRTPLPLFIETLSSFVKAARTRGMRPLLVTPPPLDAERYFHWVTQGLSKEAVLRFLGDVAHIYRWQERYSIAVRNVAAACRCPLFDLRDACLSDMRYHTRLCADGIHLNADGHMLITRAVLAQRKRLSAELSESLLTAAENG